MTNQPPKTLAALACTALLVGILVGGYPNYSVPGGVGARFFSADYKEQPSNIAAAKTPSCVDRGFEIVSRLRTPVSTGSTLPAYHSCDRSDNSFFAFTLGEFEQALHRAGGNSATPCKELSFVQQSCVRRYVDFVDTQVQYCRESAGSIQRVSSAAEAAPKIVDRGDRTDSYCRCLAGALHASVSWIGAPMPDPVPAAYPYPFGEGCGVPADSKTKDG